MANIFPFECSDNIGRRQYCVEWQDNNGVTLQRFYQSYRAAERFCLEIERSLLNEAIAELCESGSRLIKQKRGA
jgi:hypothetical protein